MQMEISLMLAAGASANTSGPVADVSRWPVALRKILRRHMNVSQFNIGILIFATVVALVCNVLQADMMSIVLAVAIGILIGFGSLVYFSHLVVSGNFFRFSVEYWMVSSICYIFVVFAATGFSFARQEKLFILADWISELSTFILPKAIVLIELGIGIVVFSFFANKYRNTRE